MSKAVLMSIHPKWVEMILNGKKAIEVRKTAPKLETPFKVYMYCIKSDKKYKDIWTTAYMTPSGNLKNMSGMVVAEFTCTKIHKVDNKGSQFSIDNDIALTNRIGAKSGLDFDDMKRYLGTKDGYAWEIEDLKVYEQPKELSEFDLAYCRVSFDVDCNECPYYDWNSILHSCRRRRLTRPPQSWCYVEEI